MTLKLLKFLTLLPVCIILQANAYYTLNTNIAANFAGDLVFINVADHSCDNIGRTPQDILHLAQIAVDKFWNDIPSSRLVLQSGQLKTVSGDFKTAAICSSLNPDGSCVINTTLKVDSNILIACNNNATTFSSTAILGKTVPNNIAGGHIVGSLFLLNDIAGSALASKSDNDLVVILAHELGHAIGLGHGSRPEDLMYYAFSSTQKALSTEDINGLTYLYGINQPDVLNCNSIELVSPSAAIPSFLLGFLPLLFFIKRRRVPVKTRS